MKKRIVSMCLAMALICAMLPQSAMHAYATQSDNVAYEIREELIEFKLSDGTLYYTNTISYPYFLGNTAAEIKINNKYSAIIEECQSNTTDFDALYQEVLQWSPDGVNGLPFYDDITAEVTYCNNGVISIKECSTMWSGGMHPYSDYVGYTYRISDGSELSLTDILSGSEHEVKSLIERYNQGVASYCKAEVVMASPFMLTSAGLCFLCNVGDAVPRAEIVIPFTEADAFSIFEESKPEVSTITDGTGYIGAVQKAIDEMQAVGWGSGYGALYDVDGNGIEELIMVYSVSMETDDGYGFPAKACSLYTMANGKAIQLIDKEILYVEAGGPSGYAAVVEHDSNIYFAITSETGETGGGPGHSINRYGTWKLYSINGESIDVNTTVEYDYFRGADIEYEKCSALFNGKSRSYREYEEWRDSLVEVLVVDGYYYDEKPESVMTLDELLAYLKENPVEDTSVSVDDSTFEDYARTEWIKQHMEYAASEKYRDEIVPGFTGRMVPEFSNAMSDGTIKAYNILDDITSFLEFQGNMDEDKLYQLILADVLYSRTDVNLIQELYIENLRTSAIGILEFLANSGDVVVAFSDKDAYQSLTDSLNVLNTLDIGSNNFSKTYSTFMDTLVKNVGWSQVTSALSKNAKLTAIGIVVDKLSIEQEYSEDIMQYIINCVAYDLTSDDFKAVIHALAEKANSMTDISNFPMLENYDGEIDWDAFRASLNSFVESLDQFKLTGMQAVAEYAVLAGKEADDKFADSAARKIAVFAVDTIIGFIPVLNNYGAVKASLKGGQLLIELFTCADERAYALEMIVRIYCVCVLMDSVVDDYANKLAEDDFPASTRFDEAVCVYRSVLSCASEYFVSYVNAKLDDTYRKYLGPSINGGGNRSALEKIEWYHNSLRMLEEQQIELRNVPCHEPAFHYDSNSETLTYNIEDSRIFIVACPVTVIVTAPTGEQIASLSDEDPQIPSGYENYFRIIETEDDSGEYMKVAVVPKDYQVTAYGTDNGSMNVAVLDYTAGVIGEVKTYLNIPVEKGATSYFKIVPDGTNGSTLVIEPMEVAENISAEAENQYGLIWITCGVAAIGILLVVILKKKSFK